MGSVIDFFRCVNKSLRYYGLLLVNKGKYKGTVIEKIRVDYLRLKLISLLFPKWVKKQIKSFGFLNYKWGFFDFDTFVALVEEIFVENEYRPDIKEKRPLIVDLGSNVGVSVMYFKTLFPKARILAFEPDPETFKCLSDNVKRAKFKQIKLVNAAVLNKEGEVSFYIDRAGTGSPLMSTIRERLPKQKITVSSVKLSEYIKERVDLLKMDIEGAETKVMKELDESGILKKNVSRLFIEYHHHINAGEDRLSKILSILEKNNYGYQINAGQKPPFERGKYEDILIFAYKRDK